MAKQLLYGQSARDKLTSGMQTLARSVRATLGPSGKNVIIDKSFSGPVSTKDGISVSKEIELPDPFENMGAKILNEVASKTNDLVGDGTSTAVVLANRLIEEGRKYVAAGVDIGAMRRGIEKAVNKAVESIRKQAIPVKNYEAVRQIARRGDEAFRQPCPGSGSSRPHRSGVRRHGCCRRSRQDRGDGTSRRPPHRQRQRHPNTPRARRLATAPLGGMGGCVGVRGPVGAPTRHGQRR